MQACVAQVWWLGMYTVWLLIPLRRAAALSPSLQAATVRAAMDGDCTRAAGREIQTKSIAWLASGGIDPVVQGKSKVERKRCGGVHIGSDCALTARSGFAQALSFLATIVVLLCVNLQLNVSTWVPVREQSLRAHATGMPVVRHVASVPLRTARTGEYMKPQQHLSLSTGR